MNHSFTCKLHRASPLFRRRSPDGATPKWGGRQGILVNFVPLPQRAQIFLSGYFDKILPIETYSPNFVNFRSGVARYHAATCISPSLMHLCYHQW